MKILNRYLTKGFFRGLVLVVPGLVGIYLVVDLFEKMDEFIEQGVPAVDTVIYFIMRTPQIIFDLFPVCILLAGIIFFAILMKNREFLAMEAVGIDPRRIIRPIASLSLFLAILMVLFHGSVVGQANMHAKSLWDQKIEGIPSYGLSSGTMFFRGKHTIWSFRTLQAGGGVLSDVDLIVFKKDFECSQIIKAEKAIFSKDGWSFIHGTQILCEDSPSTEIRPFDTITLSLKDNPGAFSRLFIPPREMGLYQLGSTILEYKDLGIHDREIEATFWNRLFYPFFGVALLVLGLSVLVKFQRGGIGWGIVLGLVIAFGGWAAWNLFCSWGEAGRTSPIIPPLILVAITFFVPSYLMSRWRLFQ